MTETAERQADIETKEGHLDVLPSACNLLRML